MPLLSLEQVGKSYWRGRHEIVVLDDVSFELDPGEFAAIFGQRAAGKTTLLRIAAGMEFPDRGRVWLDGQELAASTRPTLLTGLHKRVGWVRRPGPATDALRVIDYVALPLLRDLRHTEAHRRASRALDSMRVGDLARARWHELSDAERTLVMIAQAVVREPALVLADDPTMGLDLTEREVVVGLLHSTAAKSGMAVLMTVPDLPDTLQIQRVMSLSDGELIQAKRPAGGAVIDFPGRRGESA
jgi:ABC-type cobalamin/Fe3+-siderophores transport system ATPase subunit